MYVDIVYFDIIYFVNFRNDTRELAMEKNTLL